MKNISEPDTSKMDVIQQNPIWTNKILHSYARNNSTLAKEKNVLKDVSANAGKMTLYTIYSYQNVL